MDWSASSTPKRGADSIWIGAVEQASGCLRARPPQNPPTRRLAAGRLHTLLADQLSRGRSVLVGFDFPLGYPATVARRLGVPGRPWRGLWDALAAVIHDGPTNANNRFAVAADLNRRLTGRAAPFWGCPRSVETEFLLPRKPRLGGPGTVPERRLTDRRVPRAQPVWKLAYPGSAGSQALLGIPVVRALRRALGSAAAVWPFETGLQALPHGLGGRRVILAEVYPSMISLPARAGRVKDARQVEALATRFAELDAAGRLAPLFAGPPDLTRAERRRVETEEGWILGAMSPGRPLARSRAAAVW